jgi:hypothetical protein
MAHRGTECLNAVASVVRSYGAKAVFGPTGGGHQVAEIEFNGTVSGIRDEVLLTARTPLFDIPLKRAIDRLDVAIACDIGTAQPIG